MKQFIFQKALFIEYKTQNQNPVKIMEAQLGLILKETDIVRYEDVYGRVN